MSKPAHELLPQAVELLAQAAGLYPIEGPVQCGRKPGFDVARKKMLQGGDGTEMRKICQPSYAKTGDSPSILGHKNVKTSNFALEQIPDHCKAAMRAW